MAFIQTCKSVIKDIINIEHFIDCIIDVPFTDYSRYSEMDILCKSNNLYMRNRYKKGIISEHESESVKIDTSKLSDIQKAALLYDLNNINDGIIVLDAARLGELEEEARNAYFQKTHDRYSRLARTIYDYCEELHDGEYFESLEFHLDEENTPRLEIAMERAKALAIYLGIDANNIIPYNRKNFPGYGIPISAFYDGTVSDFNEMEIYRILYDEEATMTKIDRSQEVEMYYNHSSVYIYKLKEKK